MAVRELSGVTMVSMSTVRAKLTTLLAGFPEIRLAIVFGSMATGKQRADSDIDLAVLTASPMSSEFKMDLISLVAAELGRPVDVVDLWTAGEPILGEVFKGQRILGEDAVYATLLTRHLLDSADFLPLRQRILDERRAAWIG
jgi:predicted nucleotidyltransferase